jgi:hypothetical protein
MAHLCFFAGGWRNQKLRGTARGFLRLGPDIALEGDLACSVNGCPDILLPRRSDDNMFKLVESVTFMGFRRLTSVKVLRWRAPDEGLILR